MLFPNPSKELAGQTHLNLLGFSINNHYSIQRPVFFLSHSSFSIVPA
jgi:hypothetical protein